MYTWDTGSRWYTSDLTVTIHTEACNTVAPRLAPWHRNTGAKCLQLGIDSLLHLGIFCKSSANGHKAGTQGKVVHTLPAFYAVTSWKPVASMGSSNFHLFEPLK